MKLPKAIQNLIDDFQNLPGIGPKTAQKLAFYMLRVPSDQVKRFSDDLGGIREKIVFCKKCFNVSESEVCEVCGDQTRDECTICVVETVLDVLAIEKSGYKGHYHVLHGYINPLAGIGPDEIYISQLLTRLFNNRDLVKEIILATNTSIEGEATAMYINSEIKRLTGIKAKVTRLGRGLPVGADIEYADETTLNNALKGRVEYT